MGQSCGHSSSSGTLPLFDTDAGPTASSFERPMRLAIETFVITIAALVAARTVHTRFISGLRWFLIPGILVAAALVPTWLSKREFPRIRFNPENRRAALRLVAGASAFIILVAGLGIWLMTRLNLPIPLKPTFTGRADWLSWLLHQFLYVAVAEEVFFRGYVQANVSKMIRSVGSKPSAVQPVLVIVISAACFALAHVAVQGQIVPLLTFFPGLLLAWVFARTGSLLAPILLHGLANVTYGVIALNLA